MGRVRDGEVAPQRGRGGLRRVLDVLAEAAPALVEPDYPAAFRHLAVHNRKRALTVVFTDAIDRLASEALVTNVGSLRPRHLPLVVTLRNPALDAVAAMRPEVAADAYRKAAAEALLGARAEALARMSQALDSFIVEGVSTTIPFLKRVIHHPDFVAGCVDTKFLTRVPELLQAPA